MLVHDMEAHPLDGEITIPLLDECLLVGWYVNLLQLLLMPYFEEHLHIECTKIPEIIPDHRRGWPSDPRSPP